MYIEGALLCKSFNIALMHSLIHINIQHFVTFDRSITELSFLHQNVSKLVFIAINYNYNLKFWYTAWSALFISAGAHMCTK